MKLDQVRVNSLYRIRAVKVELHLATSQHHNHTLGSADGARVKVVFVILTPLVRCWDSIGTNCLDRNAF